MSEIKKKFRRSHVHYFIIVVLSLGVFLNPLWNADELWNYNFAKNIAEGLKPYVDISMVPTPLAAYVSSIFLRLFGKGLFSYRIAGWLLLATTFLLFYNLCQSILKSRTIAFVATMFTFALNIYYFHYNYNYLSLCLILLILLLEYKKAEKQGYINNVCAGLIYGFLPLIKQNTGGALFLVNIFICIYDAIVYKKVKDSMVRLIASIIPCIVYFLYLIYTDSLDSFIDYAIAGIGLFTHRITFFQCMFSSVITFVLCLMSIYIILAFLYNILIQKRYSREKIVFFMVTVTWFGMVIYPLCDLPHLLIGIIPVQTVYFLGIKDIKINKNQTLICDAVAVIVAIFAVIYISPSIENHMISEIHNYEGIPIDKALDDKIRKLSGYIESMEQKNVTVYIANMDSAVYTIPLDKYKKNWDMLNVGNFGTATVEELLDVQGESIFLVLKDEFELNRQSHFELINYIKEYYSCIDEVLCFDVYKKE